MTSKHCQFFWLLVVFLRYFDQKKGWSELLLIRMLHFNFDTTTCRNCLVSLRMFIIFSCFMEFASLMVLKLSIKWSYNYTYLGNAPVQWVIPKSASIFSNIFEIEIHESYDQLELNHNVIYPLHVCYWCQIELLWSLVSCFGCID